MRIGVISDTHDRLPTLNAALDLFRQFQIETLIHPGDVIAPFAAKALAAFDGALHITYGNNDGERAGLKSVLPQIQDGPLKITLHQRQILVHHFIDWCDPADIAAADVVITGHTHAMHVERQDQRLLLNPGEACGWVTGKCTVAILDLTTLEPQFIEIPT
jgi:putative phosphoesterase